MNFIWSNKQIHSVLYMLRYTAQVSCLQIILSLWFPKKNISTRGKVWQFQYFSQILFLKVTQINVICSVTIYFFLFMLFGKVMFFLQCLLFFITVALNVFIFRIGACQIVKYFGIDVYVKNKTDQPFGETHGKILHTNYICSIFI